MSALDPAPPDEVTGPWWDATREHRLLAQSCGSCSGLQHPPRAVCTSCGRTDALDWTPTTGAGAIDSFTVVHRGPAPDVEVPYVIARVRLEEGLLLLTRLVDGPADGWTVGAAVQLAWQDLADGRALPVFRQNPQTPTGPTGPTDERQDRGLPAR